MYRTTTLKDKYVFKHHKLELLLKCKTAIKANVYISRRWTNEIALRFTNKGFVMG